MKKIFLTLLTLSLFAASANAFWFKKPATSKLETAPLMSSQCKSPNRVWVGTFQLVWNELMDNVVKSPVEFTNGTSQLAQELNKQEFTKDELSENSYYTAYGIMNKTLKHTIDKALKEKFNETSDLLKGLDWSGRKFLVYAMLKKDFEFIDAFDELPEGTFGKSKEPVKYFGIQSKSSDALKDNVKVLFYNDKADFAVSLSTKTNDRVLLYRTDDDKDFATLYADLNKKTEDYKGARWLEKKDRLKVPFISFKSENDYPELEGKAIKNSDFVIDKALQTIDFKMDNKGVKLKSEAGIIMKMSMPAPVQRPPLNFYFDDTFVIFLVEKENPYFALRVNDIKEFLKAN